MRSLFTRPEETGEIAAKMLGHKLVTKQTPPGGVPVNTVMVAKALDIATEKYLSILYDREAQVRYQWSSGHPASL
jgi:succinyl-CoA synthetase beta subunit